MSDPMDDPPGLQPLDGLAADVASLRARLEGEVAGPPADPDAVAEAAEDAILAAREAEALRRALTGEIDLEEEERLAAAEERRLRRQAARELADDGPEEAANLDPDAAADTDVDPRESRRERRGRRAERLEADDGPAVDDGGGNVLEFPPTASTRKRRRSAKRERAGESAAGDGQDGGENGDPNLPRPMGFDLDALNREFALVLMSSKAVVYLERPDAPIEDQQRFLSIEAFNAWFKNRYTEFKGADGKWKVVSWSSAWMQSKKRRSYYGIEFHPQAAHERGGGSRGYLNIWSGFSLEPKADPPGACSWGLFRRHLIDNVCAGDPALYDWVFAFFADIVQNPRERPGVALVLRGPMGSGKTKVGEVFGSLFPRHYFLVDDPRYVTGQFNAHMASCLLLQADEAVWAGDKAAEGRLKGLITSPFQQIEAKGIDAIRLKNHVRLVMTSNEDWVVPAGKDERRFCVLDVGKGKAQDNAFFAAMDAELDAGGRAALLQALQSFDLSKVNLRRIPRTAALLEQKIRSFDSVDLWFFERLKAGTPTRKSRIWPRVVAKSVLVDDYVEATERLGVKRKRSETEVGMALAKLLPGLRTVRGYCELSEEASTRRWCFELPDLHLARHAFEQAVQQAVDWPSADDEGERDRFEGVESF